MGESDKKLFKDVKLGIPTDPQQGGPGMTVYVGGLQEEYQYGGQQAYNATQKASAVRVLVSTLADDVKALKKKGRVHCDYTLFEHLRLSTREVIQRIELGNKPIGGERAEPDGAGAFSFPEAVERLGTIYGSPIGSTIQIAGRFEHEEDRSVSLWRNPYFVSVGVGQDVKVGGSRLSVASIPPGTDDQNPLSLGVNGDISKVSEGSEVTVVRRLGDRLTGGRRDIMKTMDGSPLYEYEIVYGFRAEVQEVLYEFSPNRHRAESLMVIRLSQYDN